jgi:hypothetical protein
VERSAGFRPRNAPACYALTMFPNDATGDPASFAFEHIDPDNPLLGRHRVAPQGHTGRISGTTASHWEDVKGNLGNFRPVSDALKSSRIFTGIPAAPARRTGGAPRTRLRAKL